MNDASRFAAAAVAASAALFVSAAAHAADATKTTIVTSVAAVDWKPAPATLPKGTQIVLLAGDPAKPGPFVLRLKFPPHTTIAPHRHATAENVTVLTGHFYHEVGETIVRANGKNVASGGFVYLPGMTPHSLWTTNEASIVQVTGTGPFGLLYCDPNDDPSKTK